LLKARKADVVIARTGGGELVAFGPVAHSDELAPRARRILAELSRRVQIDDLDISVDPRIGGAMFPRDAKKADDLIRCAKLALTRAAADPLEPIALFELSTEAATTRRQALADDVRGALQRGEFEVYYQPQVRAGDRGIIGHEALLRWRHPALGMVSPAEFIPVAEQTGIIVEIGEWVLKTACQTAAAWPSEWRVAVNLSPMQLRQSNLVERVQEALSNSGLSPNRLELELTESLLLDDRTRAQSVFLRIRAIGVRLALDDFGVGYSSMDVLRHFPFDKIKLDKSFIDDVEANPRSLAILRAMLTMGRSLSIPVLAEGVETERQLAILQSEGCAKIQGYLTGRPVPADRIDLGSRQLLAS
jgi:EAL domain-containing protein (putative c-di-GMP-specific phosphodiesterase class I)